jgi:hypothetical protein
MNCSRGIRIIKFGLVLPLSLLAGCERAPSFDVVGSSFPAWLVCLAAGVVLTVLARLMLQRFGIALAPPILIYPSLIAMFGFALWLIFFV